ncbi:beta-lactamase/transpeptidase-like protein [Nemania abortiva]|nr:beta-lactamase/transpeptidase-like protein [Nemania abortiva]
MESLAQAIKSTAPVIQQICQVSGTTGVSIGVMKGGRLVTTLGIGRYNLLDDMSVPDDQTIYHVASLTKAMTAAAIGMLVDEGKLAFDAPLATILPDFKPRDPALQAANIQDLLSHRTGMPMWNVFWAQGAALPHLPMDSFLRTLSILPSVDPFRDSFRYWNYGYSLLGYIVERISGQSYSDFVTERIFKPLGMNRSFLSPGDLVADNYAKAYQPLAAGGFVECPRPYSHDRVVTGPTAGALSSVHDMLIFFNELLRARRAEIDNTSASQDCVLKQVLHLTSGHNFMSRTMDREHSAGCGLLRVQLPGSFGAVGYNVEHMPKMPTLGTSSDSQLIFYSQGSYPGYLSSSFMAPDEDLVIVVLTNSLSWNDAADWIGQFLLEKVLDLGNKHDFVKLAQEVADKRKAQYLESEKQFAAEKKASESKRPLDAFVGDYHHEAGTFFVRVSLKDGGLRACFQGFEGDSYNLQMVDQDVFSFFTPRDDQARRGRWPLPYLDCFEFRFYTDASDTIVGMKWIMERAVEEPSTLTRTPIGSPPPDSQSTMQTP